MSRFPAFAFQRAACSFLTRSSTPPAAGLCAAATPRVCPRLLPRASPLRPRGCSLQNREAGRGPTSAEEGPWRGAARSGCWGLEAERSRRALLPELPRADRAARSSPGPWATAWPGTAPSTWPRPRWAFVRFSAETERAAQPSCRVLSPAACSGSSPGLRAGTSEGKCQSLPDFSVTTNVC